jgi:hypothetical protein
MAVFGSDKQPAATLTNRKELWKVNKSTLAWTLINNALPTGDRVLSGFGIDKDTNKKYVFGGQVSYDYADGALADIWEIAVDGLSATQVMTGVTCVAGLTDGGVCWDPVLKLFHLVCTGGHYDSNTLNKTYSKSHWTYKPSTNTLTQLADLPLPRGLQYTNIIWDYTDNLLFLFSGYAGPTSAENVDRIWYWNGYDWAQIVARNSARDKSCNGAIAGNQTVLLPSWEMKTPKAGYLEKYEKIFAP